MNPLAREVLTSCARAGVAEYVVCAGARNAAIALPLAALAAALESPARAVRIWHFSEERAAGFFALGRTRALRRPVAVVTTSGTAAAELLPAIIEARYQDAPLVAITADRPKNLRGTGAPQAIEQAGIFGGYVSCFADIDSSSSAAICLDDWDRRQPAHVNVCLPEPEPSDCAPTPGDADALTPAPPPDLPLTTAPPEALEAFLRSARDLVVMLGDAPADQRRPLRAFLKRLGAPVLAEAVSGLREAVELQGLTVRGGDRAAAKLKTGSVLRIGGVPVWRLWRDLESRPDIPVFSVTRTELSGLARSSTVVRHMDWDAVRIPSRPRGEFGASAAASASALEALLDRYPASECGLARWLSRVIPEGSQVFLGNSLPIREWNLAASIEPRDLRCHANRGANGIDGIVSTALGLGADAEECWVVVGDLTALYDLSAPWVLEQISCRRVRIVVINNGGGRIFSRLPSLRAASSAQMRVVENQHSTGFRHWAAMWNMHFSEVTQPQSLALPDAPSVIEIVPDAEQTEAFWSEWEQC